jgi:hypothetical protein
VIDSLPQAVLEAADVSAISQLVLPERLSRDFGLWEQMRDCFHDDSGVRISWITASGPEFVRRSKGNGRAKREGVSHAHLLFRAERREGVWRLSGLDAVYLRDEIAPVMPGQTIAVDPEEVKAFRPRSCRG